MDGLNAPCSCDKAKFRKKIVVIAWKNPLLKTFPIWNLQHNVWYSPSARWSDASWWWSTIYWFNPGYTTGTMSGVRSHTLPATWNIKIHKYIDLQSYQKNMFELISKIPLLWKCSLYIKFSKNPSLFFYSECHWLYSRPF